MFTENKYTRWYFSIIDEARKHPREGYVEKHHVTPRCFGGDNSSQNIVRLSAREHFICHLLLVKMVSDTKSLMQMRKALRYMMCVPEKMKSLRWIPTGRTVEIARKEAALANRGNAEIASKISASHRGKILSDEHKKKISEGGKGSHSVSDAHKIIISQTHKNKVVSEVTREKMRLNWVKRRIASSIQREQPCG